jgi:hypothetical protein
MDIAITNRASVSTSNRAPKALAIRLRRASQPSTPSSTVIRTARAVAVAATRGTAGSPMRLAMSVASIARIIVT